MAAHARVTRRRREQGTAIVEAALVLPLLLLLLFGILELSVAFFRWQVVATAAREGARTATLERTACVPADVASEVDAIVSQVLAAENLDGGASITLSGQCTAGPQTSNVTVVVPYQFIVLSDLVTLFGDSLPATIQLTSNVVMRNP